jgi:UDP-N-acetyl-D-mannosaminuronate dehydrogenase
MSNSLPNLAGHGGHAERPRRVAILGQGYVGLPVAMRSVEVGYDVV